MKKYLKKWWFWVIVVVVISCIMYPFWPKEQTTIALIPSPVSVAPTATAMVTPEVIIKPTDEGFTVLHGELLSVTDDGEGLLIIKAKITSSYSNEATIHQNYFNVQDIILNHSGSDYSEIQYWAVADMQNGEENKVISFTVDKELIDMIYADKVIPGDYGNFVSDLYILPSLLT